MDKGKLILRVAAVLTALLLVFALTQLDLGMLAHHVSQVPVALMLGLVGLQLVTQLALNFQWWRLGQVLGLPIRFGSLLVVNAYGTLVDAANPGEKVGGEVARVVQLNRVFGLETNQSASLVTIQKVLSFSALVMVTLVATLTSANHIPFLESTVSRVVFITALLTLLALMMFSLTRADRLGNWIQKWKSEGRVSTGIKRWSIRFAEDTRAISGMKREWLLQISLSFIIWFLFPLKLHLILSQYTQISFLAVNAVTFISYFAAMLPLLPGGIGTFEAAMSGMLATFGFAPEQGLAVSLVFRFVTFWLVVALSGLLVVIWKAMRWKHERISDDMSGEHAR